MRKELLDLVSHVIRHDCGVLSRHWTPLVLFLLAPVALLPLVEGARQIEPARILVAGAGEDTIATDRLMVVMRESSEMEVEATATPVVDPLDRLRRDRLDLLLNFEGDPPTLSIYTTETDWRRIADLQRLAAGILRAHAVIAARSGDGELVERPPLYPEIWWARPALYEDLFMLGSLPVNPLFEYFPQAADRRLAMLPGFLMWGLTLLPFALVLATAELATIQGESWSQKLVGNAATAIVPVLVALLHFLAFILVAELAFEVQIKAGIFRMVLVVVPAAFAAAFSGVLALKLSRNRVELAGLCLLYVLAMLSLAGSAVAFVERPDWVRALAQALPATHLLPVLQDWLFGAPFSRGTALAGLWLLVLAVCSGGLATAVARRPSGGASAPSIG